MNHPTVGQPEMKDSVTATGFGMEPDRAEPMIGDRLRPMSNYVSP